MTGLAVEEVSAAAEGTVKAEGRPARIGLDRNVSQDLVLILNRADEKGHDRPADRGSIVEFEIVPDVVAGAHLASPRSTG